MDIETAIQNLKSMRDDLADLKVLTPNQFALYNQSLELVLAELPKKESA